MKVKAVLATAHFELKPMYTFFLILKKMASLPQTLLLTLDGDPKWHSPLTN